MDFIQYGGLDILDKAIRHHVNDGLIAHKGPSLLKYLISKYLAFEIEYHLRKYVYLYPYSCWSQSNCRRN